MRRAPVNKCHGHWLCQAGSVFTGKLKSVPCARDGAARPPGSPVWIQSLMGLGMEPERVAKTYGREETPTQEESKHLTDLAEE